MPSIRRILKKMLKPFYPWVQPWLHRRFYADLIGHTQNWSHVSWVGHPIWQPVLDLWIIQETLSEIRPELLIECGTYQGGSALFYAHILDLLDYGQVITIDIQKLHSLCHPRITFLLGSSVEDRVVTQVKQRVAQTNGPVMVILDSDHSAAHVAEELSVYHHMVTPQSFLLVQDGMSDLSGRTGPLRAISEFLLEHPEFEVDEEHCGRFLVTHHPMGWLRCKY